DRRERDDRERNVQAAQHVTDGGVLSIRGLTKAEGAEMAEHEPGHEGQREEGDGPADGDGVAGQEPHGRVPPVVTMSSTDQSRPIEISTKPFAQHSTLIQPPGSSAEVST